MEVNLNLVLFEELKEKSNGTGAEARIVIIRESKDMDSVLEDGTRDSYHFPE